MSDSTLAQRIKAEFDARAQRVKASEAQQSKESQDREARLAKFGKVCDELKEVWGPRIAEFAKQFGDKARVKPTVSPSTREAKVLFETDLASVSLTLTASASADLANLVLDYDLYIVPIFFEYERYSRLEQPLDKVNKEAVGKWIDDQLVSCVKAYLSIQDNEHHVKRALVEDPISKTRFLKDKAAAKLEHDGRTHYFSSDDTLRQYKEKLQIK